MHDVLGVAVVECHQDLFESFGGEYLCKVFILNYSVEQFATLAKLLYQIDVLFIFKVLKKFNDVGMVLKSEF